MRIGIGLNLLQPHTGGAGNYALTLLRHWSDYAPQHQLVLFSFDHNEEMLATLPADARRHEHRVRVQEDVAQHLSEIDVYFCPFSSLWPRPLPIPTVLMFHDMQERFFPEFFTREQLRERFYHYDWSLRMADVVLTVSDFTRQSCVEITGIARNKIARVYHAPDELPEPQRPVDWDARGWDHFLYYPANFWPHKNHELLLAALKAARAAGVDLRCVMTGSLMGREAEWNVMVSQAGLGAHVRHLGRRNRAEVSWLYRHARALVFPSLFEGFGIPLIEAMQCGCPIACAKRTSLPEIAGDAAAFFDPEDSNDVARALEQVWRDEPVRDELIARGRRRVQEFNARQMIEGHVTAFELARRRYRRWRHWYRERFLKPCSERPRDVLLPREAEAAQRLLRATPRNR